MRKQSRNNKYRFFCTVLPLMLLAACDSGLGPDFDIPQERHATVSFDATAHWDSYGEDIHSSGVRSFRYVASNGEFGEYEVQFQSEGLDADFKGLESGDRYQHELMTSNDWSVLVGRAGSEQVLSETIMLTNERTNEEAEGLVITKVRIGPHGDVSFEVQEVISLP